MPQTTFTDHPTIKNLTLTFTEEDHRYFDNEGREYTSVTTVVKSHFPTFDSRIAAERVAQREGSTADAVIEGWNRKRDLACEYGTRCHEVAESYLTALQSGFDHEPRDVKEAKAFEAVRLACIELSQWFDLVACEQVLFAPSIKLAGTADLIMRSKCGSITYVLDWKTNEAHAMTDAFYERGTWPCHELPHNSLSHYTLQLSIYEELLRSEGHIDRYSEVRRALIWIPPFSTCPRWVPLERRSEASVICANLNLSKAG